MIRLALPAVLCLAGAAGAEDLRVPDLTPGAPAAPPACATAGGADTCARTLACIGSDGLYFDGQVRGRGSGIVKGVLSDGRPCAGSWRYNRFGIATAEMACRGGLTAGVIYFSQDGETGTGIGRGTDSEGRAIRIWTGENVLAFLTPDGKTGAELPCGAVPIPMS